MEYFLAGVLMALRLMLDSSATSASPVSPASPVDVTFDSVDFKDVLRWTPPADDDNADLRYDVQWKIYGAAEWSDAARCQGIREHHCDLSAVTSDPREWYYARLRASSPPSWTSQWVLSPRFSPRLDTKISAPPLSLNVSEQGILVLVETPPTLARKLHASRLHSHLVYNIYLLEQKGQQEVFKVKCCSGSLLLSKVKRKIKYCFRSQSVLPRLGFQSVRGPEKCIATP
ncbi:interleukin-22 receptor subunit alpha-2 [Stigmatopora nigra]